MRVRVKMKKIEINSLIKAAKGKFFKKTFGNTKAKKKQR